MTTVFGFSEMKGRECSTGIAASRRGIGSLGVALKTVVGADPTRFAGVTPSAVNGAVSATSTQGPQWDDEAGIAMADAA
jgi:hypothetical protein